jgi:Protein of unknown function (DUF2924)
MIDQHQPWLGLPAWDKAALITHWQNSFKQPVPRHIRVEFMQRAIGWHMQVQAMGGLDQTVRRQLNRQAAAIPLLPGTRLIRVWQGVNHQVTVLDEGFSYEGKTWRSLSAIARAITRTSWNGKVFFGVAG